MVYDSVSILTLPADNGTWGVGVVTSARDAALRRLKDVDVWAAWSTRTRSRRTGSTANRSTRVSR